MIAERVLHPGSKLATTRTWASSTLGQECGVEGADVDELYRALDWLVERQGRIEAKLARRHLREGGLALYDVSSSSYEGKTCVLARRGHNRDGERLPCIAYGMLTDREGRRSRWRCVPGTPATPRRYRRRWSGCRSGWGFLGWCSWATQNPPFGSGQGAGSGRSAFRRARSVGCQGWWILEYEGLSQGLSDGGHLRLVRLCTV